VCKVLYIIKLLCYPKSKSKNQGVVMTTELRNEVEFIKTMAKSGANFGTSKVVRLAWLGIFCAIVDFALTTFLTIYALWRVEKLEQIVEIPSLAGVLTAFFLYTMILISLALILTVSSAVEGKSWLKLFAIGAFICTPITIVLMAIYGQLLPFLVNITVFAAVPALFSLFENYRLKEMA